MQGETLAYQESYRTTEQLSQTQPAVEAGIPRTDDYPYSSKVAISLAT